MTPVMIGLEVHVELDTERKLFCGCERGETCPVCRGFPGSRPVTNQAAVEQAVRLCLALQCLIAPLLRFERKCYFYPDLPKGYQITQRDDPVGRDGSFRLRDGAAIPIWRVQLEEDAAALRGDGEPDDRRAGRPLCEIVTPPVMTGPRQARRFIEDLLPALAAIGVFHPDRCLVKTDANVSLGGGPKIEVKGVMGAREVEQALQAELFRQQELLRAGQPVMQETRGWDPRLVLTVPQRGKESDAEYGFMPEPDLPLMPISASLIGRLQAGLPPLPGALAQQWTKEGIDPADAWIIASKPGLRALFEETRARTDQILAARWVRKDVLRVLNDAGKPLEETFLDGAALAALIEKVRGADITAEMARRVLKQLAVRQEDVASLKGAVTDTGAVSRMCAQVLAQEGRAVADYQAGDRKVFHHLLGMVMRMAQGRADPRAAGAALERLLKEGVTARLPLPSQSAAAPGCRSSCSGRSPRRR